MNHPLWPLLDLPSVRDLNEEACSVIAAVHRHRANRRDWATTGGIAGLRAARASAILEHSVEHTLRDEAEDPVLQGALRVSDALDPARKDRLDSVVGMFVRAPWQVMAKLHTVAAKDIVPAENLGRPRLAQGDDDLADRLRALGEILLLPRAGLPATLLGAIAHAELLVLQPFGAVDGVVARAISRVVLVAHGVDSHNLSVPESYWLKKRSSYFSVLENYKSGTELALGQWLKLYLEGIIAGGKEAMTIADSSQGG